MYDQGRVSRAGVESAIRGTTLPKRHVVVGQGLQVRPRP